jgi:hypothetical protein
LKTVSKKGEIQCGDRPNFLEIDQVAASENQAALRAA